MALPHRQTLPSHLRNSSTSTNQSPALLARINEKKIELANLKELQVLSAGLADQMAMLEEKLGTLSGGTEAVATVLANWHNVLRAISMASSALPKPKESENAKEDEETVPLPQTLVRIPTQSAATVIAQAENLEGNGSSID